MVGFLNLQTYEDKTYSKYYLGFANIIRKCLCMMHAHVVHFIPELIQFPHIWLSVHIEQVTNDDGKEEWWLVKRLESATMKNWFFHLHSFLLPEEKPFWKKDKVLRNPFWESATLVKAKSRSCDIIFSWTLPFMEFSSLMSQLNLIKILTWTSVVQICNILGGIIWW